MVGYGTTYYFGLSIQMCCGPWGGHDANSGLPLNIIYSLPCRNPCRLFIHDNFFGLLDLHLQLWSNLDGLGLLNQWEILVMSLWLVCEVAPKLEGPFNCNVGFLFPIVHLCYDFQGPLGFHGHVPWFVCKAALSTPFMVFSVTCVVLSLTLF